jgi:hypothetical protein
MDAMTVDKDTGAWPGLDLLPTRFEPGSAEHRELVDRIKRKRAGAVDFGDPTFDSARWLAHTPATLARELHCTLLEAFDRLERIRRQQRRRW